MSDIEELAAPNPATTPWVPVGPGVSSLAGQPGAKVYSAATPNISSGAWTMLTFDTKSFDTHGMWSSGHPTRLTCQTAGQYVATAIFAFYPNAAGQRIIGLAVNGTTEYTQGGPSAGAGAGTRNAVSEVFNLNLGDYIEAVVFQDSGTALPVSAGVGNCSLSMVAAGGTTGPPGPAGAGTPAYGASLPASPYDGQEAILVDSVTNPSYQWRFRYNAGSSSIYKWEFIGGASAYIEPADATPTAAGAFYTDTSAGATVILPRAGNYLLQTTAAIGATPGNTGNYLAFTADQGNRIGQLASASQESSLALSKRLTFAAAGAVVSNDLLSVGAVALFNKRILMATPVRVS